MTLRIGRRDFIKTTAAFGAGLGLTSVFGSKLLAAEAAKGAPHAEKLGWRLGLQAYSFNGFTFFEAVDMNAALGLHVIEAFPGQRINGNSDAKMGPDMSPEVRKEVLKKLSDSGVKLANFGVGAYDRKHFEFAKEMGIETLVSEPNKADFEAINKLCDEFGVNLAIHNHPKPSIYWSPESVLEVVKGCGKRVGACADTGHWPRSGLVPLDCIKQLKGRIISFHFKDLNKMGPGAEDVEWGTGVCNVKGMLQEIFNQGFQGVFSIENEHLWDKRDEKLAEIAKSIAFFDKVAAELLAQKSSATHRRSRGMARVRRGS